MSPEEWAEIFEAGWRAIPYACLDAGDAVARALAAMGRTARAIGEHREALLRQQQAESQRYAQSAETE